MRARVANISTHRMKAYDVHEHENVVFDDRSAVIGDHGLVDDDQRLDESLATD